jgi:antirestriction protein ArdC
LILHRPNTPGDKHSIPRAAHATKTRPTNAARSGLDPFSPRRTAAAGVKRHTFPRTLALDLGLNAARAGARASRPHRAARIEDDPMTEKQSIYDRVTETILKQIEASPGEPVMPWHRPAGSALQIPRNATTDNTYRGINILMLWIAADMNRYPTGLWASYKQWTGIGAQVRKGEKAAQVVFYKEFDVEPTEKDDDGKRRVLRASYVFNAAQVDGFATPSPEPTELGPVRRTAEFERFVASTGARINHGGHRAFYSLTTDEIAMPEEKSFTGTPTMDRDLGYMSVLAHELGHWSGAKHRLDRQLGNRFGTHAHAVEEIIAEMSAAFVCARLGLASEPRADHAQYIAHYLSLLRDDSRAIFTAAAAASKAAAYLFSFSKSVDTPCPATSPTSTEPSTSCAGQTTAMISCPQISGSSRRPSTDTSTTAATRPSSTSAAGSMPDTPSTGRTGSSISSWRPTDMSAGEARSWSTTTSASAHPRTGAGKRSRSPAAAASS